MKKSLLIISFLAFLLFPEITFTQLDTDHYFPPLFGREDQGTHSLVLSTHSSTPFDVTVKDGAGNLITTLTISNANSTTYTFGSGTSSPLLVTEAELNDIMTNKGLVLSGAFPFYATIRVVAGAQATAMTSKGEKAALGTDFRTGHLYQNTGDAFRKSNVFGIMATEDNTTITIDDIRPGVIFRGTTATGSPLTSPSVTVTLNAGETYVVAAFLDEAGATQNVNGVNGTHISSDKPIAVTTGSWLGGNPLIGGTPSNGRDIGTDQIVPSDVIGSEYVLIKGEGIDNEKVIVVGAYDNTDIMINGNPIPVATINAGDYYVIDGAAFSAFDNLYLEASKDVYVYQTTNGGNGATDDNERQNDLIFLPPVGCTGSKNVILPNVNWVGTAYINIIANAGANVYVNGTPLGAGDAITGTSDYVTYKLTSGYTGDVVITSDDLIRVALINLSGNIGAACYFSGFTKDVVVQTQTVNGDNIALEGCIPASFTFSLDSPSNDDTQITYTVAGTANNGVDYTHIDNTLTIPAGQLSATVFINSISDGIPEGQESIYIIYQPDACSPVDTAFLFIDDAQPIEFTIDGTNLDCYEDNSGEILVNATGGFPGYTYYVTTNGGTGTTTTYTTNPITGLAAGTYSVQVYDIYGCKADALVIGGIFDADTTFLPDGTGVSYTTTINISGFGAGEILDDMSQLQQICATMEHSYLGDLQLKVISPSGQEVILKQFAGGGSCDLGEPFASGPVDGANSTLTDPGVGYEYCWNTAPVFGTMVAESNAYTHTIPASTGGTYTDNYLPQGSYTSFENLNGLLGSTLDGIWTLEVSDQFALDNGYIFNWNISLVSDLPDTLVTLIEPDEFDVSGFITQAQCGTNDGAIDITSNGDFLPFTFDWSNGATTEDISGIGAGTYELIVTDANGCTDTSNYILNNISSLNTSSTITSVTCSGGNNGAINLSTSGGTPPYTHAWSNGATTEDITSLTAGLYNLTITDANGCIYNQDFTVNTLPSMNVVASNISNEACGTANGSIDISVSGGSGSYGYTWSNGQLTQDISSLTAGSYQVTVIDGFGCTTQQTFNVINDVSNCSQYCYLDVVVENITDEICGNSSGSIDISVIDATQPYSINWSNGATQEDISNLPAGTYIVTINDANQCEHIETIVVNNNSGSLAVNSFAIIDENCGDGQGSISINILGGVLPYTYSWSNGSTSNTADNLSEGNYSVTITDGNGCTINENYTVTNNTGTLNYSAVVTNEYCDINNGNINLTVTGASGTLSYLWSNGATSQDINGLNPGTFTCTITDQSGCQLITDPIVVSNIPGTLALLTYTISNENCDDNQGSIDLMVIGGSTPYSFSWSNGATSEDISGLNEGTYSCVIIDASGCSVNSGNLTVWNSPGNLALDTDYTENEICGNNNGAIYVNTSGGTAPYSYLWSDNSTNEDNIGLSAGAYSLTVTDANGCTLFLNETILNEPGTLAIDNAVITNENCGNSNGSINVFISGGNAPYSYAWSNGATTQDLSTLSAGNYEISVTDNNGCNLTNDYTITNNTGTLNYTYVATTEFCGNGLGSIDISVSGGTSPYSYNWSNGATSEDISNLNAGNYYCIITDNLGCELTTVNIELINNPGNLTVTSVANNETCGLLNGTIDLTVSGGDGIYSYLWSTGATTQDLSGLAANNYSYTVTDGSGCSVTNDIAISNSAGSFNATYLAADENCNDNNGNINVTVSGGISPYTYLWNTGATSEDLTGLNSGAYTCTITDAAGCIITLNAININNNGGTLSIDNVLVTDENCGNGIGSIDLTIAGGTMPYTYSWNTGATTQDLLLLSAGNYNCTVTDASGCMISTNQTVNNDAGNLQIFAQTLTPESCSNNNGAIDITMAGGTSPYTYLWSNGATTQDIASLNASTYTLFVNDASGCSFTTDFVINDAGGNLNIDNVIITNEICGNNNGGINIHVSNGTAPYNFSWSNGILTEDISNVSQGSYTVTVTDAFGCQTTGSYTINNDIGTLSLTSSVVTDENCGDGNGAINISITGGVAPITYNWSNGASTQDIGSLTAGNYTVEVNDIFGCAFTHTETVQNISGGLAITLNSITDEICGTANGAIDVLVSGGSAPYTFVWSNGASTEDITNLSAATYDLVVTDASGCSVTSSFTILNNTGTFSISGVVIQNANCVSASGFIDLSVSGGSTPYNYNWSNGATSQDIAGLLPGNYSCQLTDNAGCIINYNATIGGGSGNLNTSVLITDATCGNANGEIQVDVTGGSLPYNFSWTGSTPTTCCTYTLNMSDLGNSWNGASITVLIDGVSIGNFTVTGGGAGTGTFDVCDGETITLQWNPGGFDNEVSFNLTDADGAIIFTQGASPSPGIIFTTLGSCPGAGPTSTSISNLIAGSYDLTITDNNGCTITETYTVSDINNMQINVTSVTNENCNQNNGQIIYNVTGGTAPYTTTANGFTDGPPVGTFSNLNEDSWVLFSTDAEGCTATTTVSIVNTATFNIASSVTNEVCGNLTGAIDLTLTGGGPSFAYSWSNGATSQDLTGLSAGTYTCTITDQSNGNCQDFITITVGNDVDFTLSDIITDENCGEQMGSIDITITGSSDLTYQWSNGATTEDISGLTAGTYDLIVINNVSGCAQNFSFIINNNTTGLAATALINDEFCGNADGNINQSITGGVGPFTYAWSNGSTAQDISGLVAGIYTVTITDLNDGCMLTQNYEVLSDGNFTVTVNSVIDESCGLADGQINISVSGPGSGGATYAWSNGATTQDISGLAAGSYSCIVSSSFGCDITISETVFNNTDITVVAASTDEICGNGNGSIDITAGGSTNLSFNWSNGETTEDISNLTAGNYSCVVTNLTSGCQESINVTIVNNTNPGFSLSATLTDEFCGSTNGAIDLTVTGSGTFVYTWSNGMTTEDLSSLSAGNYTVDVENSDNGCIVSESYNINNTTSGMMATAIINDDFCSGAHGAIDLTVTGGIGPFDFNWNTGETTEDISNLSAGTYTVTITDLSDNCQMTLSYDVLNSVNFDLNATVQNASCSTCTTGSIDLSINEFVADGPYTFSWSNGATTEDISGLIPGTYTVTVTGVSGCQVTLDVVVGDNNDVGIEESTTTNFVSVYPNPANGNFTLIYNLEGQSERFVYVTNNLGEKIYQENIIAPNGEMAISLANFARGVYYVHVVDGKTTYTIKLVLARS